MRHLPPLAALAGLAFLWTTWSAPAAAGTLQVNPVLVELGTDHRIASITVRNEESTPVTIRAYPLSWSQIEGENVYSDSSDVIVSPPVFTLAPGATQVVRVGLRRPSATGRAYRLIVEEVPAASPGGGIRVALRLDLPLFASIEASPPNALRWSITRAGGEATLEASNPSSGYVRLDPAAASEATGLDFGDRIFFGTILPGATRRWTLSEAPRVIDAVRARRLQRSQDDGSVRAPLIRP
jgi:fimbrial chaperone protein